MAARVTRMLFYLSRELLHVVYENGAENSIPAVSGGSRGQKHAKQNYPYGKNDEALFSGRDWRLKAYSGPKRSDLIVDGRYAGKNRGGPIPPGFYLTGKQNTAPNGGAPAFSRPCIALIPTLASEALYCGRDGFYIHGRGSKGSDGCIVPTRGNVDLEPLIAGLSEGVILRVVDDAEDIKELDRMHRISMTA